MQKETITKQAVRQVLLDYWRQYKKNPWNTGIGFLLPAIGSIFIFFIPPLIIARLVNIFVANKKIELSTATNYIIFFGVAWLVGEILWRIGEHFIIKLETNGINNLAKTAFHKLTERDYTFYTNNFVGSLTKKGLAYTRSFEAFTDTLIFNVVSRVFPLIFAVIILWRYSFWIPLVLVVGFTIALLIAFPIIRRRSKLVALRHNANSKLSGRLSDTSTNILTVKSFAKENYEEKIYGEYVNDFTNKYKKAADYNNRRLNIVISPLYVLINVAGLIIAVFFAQKLNLQVGSIIVVFSYYAQISEIFWDINNVYRRVESSISEAAEFTQLFTEPADILDIPNAKKLNITKADIQFLNVGFRYNNQSEKISFLNNFNLEIKSKQKIGLVGLSGEGKTTITKLLLRFMNIQSGSITIDGQDIDKVTQSSLREAIAYVPQEPLLFHRTLFENIAYGKENSTKEEIIKAAKIAHADEFIVQLPNGYDTLVGERGIKLSGGQRQRVAIARALLKQAPILVLDEATSSLDSESEKYIQEGLLKLTKDKTTLVIAHRLSTIKHLDRIIVLDQGNIVEDGTHNELIKQKGLYAKLWSHQSGGFLNQT